LPADTPIALCFPTGPPQKRSLVGLHPKWRDVVCFGYILDGAISYLGTFLGGDDSCSHSACF
jgi:hypothetical protein